MTSALTWDGLRGRRVGVYGLGREGLANVRACLARGLTPILVDDDFIEDVTPDKVAGILQRYA